MRCSWLICWTGLLALAGAVRAQRQMEFLDRGLVAINRGNNEVFLSWRLLGTDPDEIGFNVYRVVGSGPPEKLTVAPLTNETCFVDSAARLEETTTYAVRPALPGGKEKVGRGFALAAHAPAVPYLSIPLNTPAGYTPNDASVGDLDGDGEYEIVLHQAGRARDNSQPGLTDPPILQAYRLDGFQLWQINLGRNIREGAHYTQFMVYDLDGDGSAEIACKTADGTVDGRGKVIGDPNADWRDTNRVSRTYGRIVRGPEYFTIFDGRTGAALVTTNYVPPRGSLDDWGGVGGNGGNDNYGNRADRFLACVAYLDGKRPSVVMCRGYYGRSVLAAWDWRDGQLELRWVFDSMDRANPYSGQGGHQLSVADVDADGRDEIVYHAMVVDDDGRGLYSTGLRHGDALHVGDLDPRRPGLEIFTIHENEGRTAALGTPGMVLRDAATGHILWSAEPGADVGRGLTADLDPRHPGEEMWGGPTGLRTAKGERIGRAPRSTNFAVWWDGDLLRELLDRNRVSKWDWNTTQMTTIFTAEDCAANNSSKATPCLSADILGDWREEVIWHTRDRNELRVYTTTIPTAHRLRTLMHDPQYRLSVAWQNVGYNQPPHPSYFLGEGMIPPSPPKIVTVMAK